MQRAVSALGMLAAVCLHCEHRCLDGLLADTMVLLTQHRLLWFVKDGWLCGGDASRPLSTHWREPLSWSCSLPCCGFGVLLEPCCLLLSLFLGSVLRPFSTGRFPEMETNSVSLSEY